MARLSPEDIALWRKVADSVTPMKGRRLPALPALPIRTDPAEALPLSFAPAKPNGAGKANVKPPLAPPRPHANTLDGGWDKRLAKGSVAPDRTIDLHGHNLHGAHALLDHALGEAIRQGARLVLLITGRPARDNPRLPPTTRGVIRASVVDWIAAGPWGSHIAAIRAAHPRHGGSGALYLVVRRAK
ncbi:MAG: Smr/MutS family protein [Sphingomonadales bacterium]|nr:Smr/MutS family protein [Sphingomonadales bacterium]